MIISNKTLYQLEIKSTKLLPVIIAILYISNTTCSYYYTDIREFSMIGGASLLLLSKLYVSSFTYKLCIHHRIFIYYILVCNIIDIIDYFSKYIMSYPMIKNNSINALNAIKQFCLMIGIL